MFTTIQWLWERNNSKYATAEKMEKAAHFVNIYKEVTKPRILYLSSRLLTLVQREKLLANFTGIF